MTRQTTHDVTYRTQIDLTGTWQFVTDPSDEGAEKQWYAENWPETAQAVDLPQAWEEDEQYREYTGTAWYRRTFDLDDEPDDQDVLLRFDAVDYETTVWVNGDQTGQNRGGYLPFTFDATDAVTEGENTIVVAVTDPENIDEIPHGKQGEPWYQRVSGIWQDVSVDIVPSTRVSTVRATPSLDNDSVTLDIDSVVPDETPSELVASVTIRRNGTAIRSEDIDLDGSGTGVAEIELDDPEYWTPESPALYDIDIELRDGETIVDRYDDYFGMRSIEVEDGQLYLNGEPYYMRGALDQGYYPETLYRPFDEELFEKEIRTAKELGFNLLRKHIKPAHPDFLELADRIGILVWEEPANPTRYTERSRNEVREQVQGMIERDYNHPSVIIWSLYNEEWGIGGYEDEESLWDDEEKQAYLADLYEEAREWDPSRVFCDNSGWAHVATDINDYHRYFVSPDRATAWSEDLEAITSAPEDNYGKTVTDPEEAPLIVSEFGTWGFPDLPAVEEYYDGTPPWFEYDFLDDPIKRPSGVHDRFEETTLPDVFDDWAELADAWQRREFRSIKDVIEQMRSDPGIDGYVITEFSDIEWEFNGMLDYRREEKNFHDELVQFNAPTMVSVELDSHAVRSGEDLTGDIVVANDRSTELETEITWSLFDQSETVPVDIDGASIVRVEDAVQVTVPDVGEVRTVDITLTGSGVPDNNAPVTVIPDATSASDSDAIVYTDSGLLEDPLEETGFSVTETLDESVDVALVTEPREEIEEFAASGGAVLRLPGADGHMVDDDLFEYRDLPETESWNLVASMFYTDGEPVAKYTGTCPGWELEGLYPYDVVTELDDDDDIHVGYVEGWLANWSSPIVVREHGDGHLGAFTFRVTGDEVTNPVGLAILSDVIDELTTTEVHS